MESTAGEQDMPLQSMSIVEAATRAEISDLWGKLRGSHHEHRRNTYSAMLELAVADGKVDVQEAKLGVFQKSVWSMSQQLTVLFLRVWSLQNDLDVLAKSRKARLLNKWKERHGIPEAGTCWGLWDLFGLTYKLRRPKDHARSWQLCLDQFLLSIHNLISGNYLLKCLAFLFEPLYLQSWNTLCQEDHQAKLAELGWTPEERFGAHGEYPPGILRPTSDFWISLWFQPPLKPRSTGIRERRTWSQSSSTSTAQLSTLLLSHLSCILFARAQRCGGKKTWRWHMPNVRGATGI